MVDKLWWLTDRRTDVSLCLSAHTHTCTHTHVHAAFYMQETFLGPPWEPFECLPLQRPGPASARVRVRRLWLVGLSVYPGLCGPWEPGRRGCLLCSTIGQGGHWASGGAETQPH